MEKMSCRFCGVDRRTKPKACWGCGEFDELIIAALARHFPGLTHALGSANSMLLGEGT
jgi:hypothetical protein